MNTRVTYLYRDASNDKTYPEMNVILKMELSWVVLKWVFPAGKYT
ncbi:MAG: hypothetical protein ABEK50_16190 [bacterium]